MASVTSNSCVCVHRFRSLFNALDLKDSVFSGDWVIPWLDCPLSSPIRGKSETEVSGLSSEPQADCLSGVVRRQLLKLGDPAQTRFPSWLYLVSMESILMAKQYTSTFTFSKISLFWPTVAFKMKSYLIESYFFGVSIKKYSRFYIGFCMKLSRDNYPDLKKKQRRSLWSRSSICLNSEFFHLQ